MPEEYLLSNPTMNGIFVSKEAFSTHINWLKKNFTILSLKDLMFKIKGEEKFHGHLCAITFDDGWYDNFEYAFPVLEKARVPATVFLIGDNIGTNRLSCWDLCFEIVHEHEKAELITTGITMIDELFRQKSADKKRKAQIINQALRKLSFKEFSEISDNLKKIYNTQCKGERKNNYRFLDWQQIRKMQSAGIDFAYHSKQHFILTKLPKNMIKEQVKLPVKKAYEHGVNLKNIFCYPDGQYNAEIKKVLYELKYNGAVSLNRGYNSHGFDPFELKRVNIHQDIADPLPVFTVNLGIKMINK